MPYLSTMGKGQAAGETDQAQTQPREADAHKCLIGKGRAHVFHALPFSERN